MVRAFMRYLCSLSREPWRPCTATRAVASRKVPSTAYSTDDMTDTSLLLAAGDCDSTDCIAGNWRLTSAITYTSHTA